jgi:hypothetical protein
MGRIADSLLPMLAFILPALIAMICIIAGATVNAPKQDRLILYSVGAVLIVVSIVAATMIGD